VDLISKAIKWCWQPSEQWRVENKLNDNKLGINTYAALLCTLQKEGVK